MSGCFQNPFQQDQPVQEPPLIPAPPVTPTQNQAGHPSVYVGTYADMAKLREQGVAVNPLLLKAVSQSIAIGVLKPNGPLDQFHPEQPITLREFRTWATAFQAAEAGVPIPEESTPSLASSQIALPSKRNEKIASQQANADPLSSPMNPQKLELIAPDMQLGTHRLADSENLSREALCSLGVFLAKKYTDALSLSPQAIEGMTPSASETNADEAFSLFKDFAAISAWAKPFVAVAYRESLLQKAFNMNANQLTIEDGFKPTQTATRAEAIVLLHVLFGHVATPGPTSLKTSHLRTLINATNGMKGSYTPLGLTTNSKASLPLASLQTVQQSGPQGSQRFQKSVVAH